MGLDALLASTTTAEEGGVRTESERGVLCFDVGALASVLRQR